MTKHKFTFFSDPGHGWLKVPRSLLVDLGISDKISSYSYQKNTWVYLEEDGDCLAFFQAFQQKFGHKPECVEKWTNNYSGVRNFPRYRA